MKWTMGLACLAVAGTLAWAEPPKIVEFTGIKRTSQAALDVGTITLELWDGTTVRLHVDIRFAPGIWDRLDTDEPMTLRCRWDEKLKGYVVLEAQVASPDALPPEPSAELLALQKQFNEALVRKDVQRVRQMLAQGFDLKTRRADRVGWLELAALFSSPEVVQSLLDAGSARDDSQVVEALVAVAKHWSPNVENLRVLLGTKPDLARHGPRVLCAALLPGTGVDTSAIVEALLEAGIDPDAEYDGSTPFLWAVENRPELVPRLLEAGADLRSRNRQGKNALHIAAKRAHLELVRDLLAAGLELEARDSEGKTALMHAVKSYRPDKTIELVRTLLVAGADPNLLDEADKTALSHAERESEELKKVLRDAGAKLGRQEARRALELAIEAKDPEKIREALRLGADLNAPTFKGSYLAEVIASPRSALTPLLIELGAQVNVIGTRGTTPLKEAIDLSHDKVIVTLLKAGAIVDPQSAEYVDSSQLEDATRSLMRETLQQRGAALAPVEWRLHWAVARGDVETVMALLRGGADPKTRDAQGRTPLQRAVSGASDAKDGDETLIGTLVKAGADVNVRSDLGEPALVIAARHEPPSTIEAMLRAGAKPDLLAADGWTALTHAAKRGSPAIVKLLVEAGAAVDPPVGHSGVTPLIAAACNGNTYTEDTRKVVESLLAARAEVNVYDRAGVWPLICALGNGEPQDVRRMIQAGANVNASGKGGLRPLMLAARWQDAEGISVLLEAGADPGAKDEEGDTALDYADPDGSAEVLQLLRDAAARKR